MGLPVELPGAEPCFIEDELEKLVSSADTVIIGEVKKKVSFLSEEENYIFSDYTFSVDEVLKDNNIDPLSRKITVTRPGGAVLIDGCLAVAKNDLFFPLHRGGVYLLFLKYLPDTGTYKACNGLSTFLLSERKVIKMSKAKMPRISKFKTEDVTELATFLDIVRDAINHPSDIEF